MCATFAPPIWDRLHLIGTEGHIPFNNHGSVVVGFLEFCAFATKPSTPEFSALRNELLAVRAGDAVPIMSAVTVSQGQFVAISASLPSKTRKARADSLREPGDGRPGGAMSERGGKFRVTYKRGPYG